MAPGEIFGAEETVQTTYKVYYNNQVIHEQEDPLLVSDVRDAANEQGLRKFTAQDNGTGRDLYSSDFGEDGFRGDVKIVSYNAPKSE
jgi:hypothetical protein